MKGLPKLSNNNKWFLGVCGGLAEYFGVNANILRALFVLAGFQIVPYLSNNIKYLILNYWRSYEIS